MNELRVIVVNGALQVAPGPDTKIFGTVKTDESDESHPFGQWSAALSVETPGVFKLTFLSEEAPKLDPGAVVTFYRAPLLITTLQVVEPKGPQKLCGQTKTMFGFTAEPCTLPHFHDGDHHNDKHSWPLSLTEHEDRNVIRFLKAASWDALGTGYPEDNAPKDVKAAFDTLAPVRPSGTRRPIFDWPGKVVLPEPLEVWNVAVAVATAVANSQQGLPSLLGQVLGPLDDT